jgi:hypothetical protein
MILRFLAGNWQWMALVATIVAGFLYITGLHSQIDARTAERDLARSQVSTLGKLIENQNDAVLALEAAAAMNRDVYLAGLKAAEKQAIKLEIKASDYLATPIPTDPAEACVVADHILGEVTQ